MTKAKGIVVFLLLALVALAAVALAGLMVWEIAMAAADKWKLLVGAAVVLVVLAAAASVTRRRTV